MSETIIREYNADVFDSKLVLIGTHHSIDYELVLEKLERYNFDSVCCELGLANKINEKYPEHKAALEYSERYGCEVKGVDVDDIKRIIDQTDLDPRKYKRATRDDFEDADNVSEDDIWENLAGAEQSYPEGYMFFMRLRNQNMALGLKKQLQKHGRVAMIVGSAHVPGILQQLDWSID